MAGPQPTIGYTNTMDESQNRAPVRPLQTPLHAWHVAHKGRMVDFAGFSMPVQYTSIISEHIAVRKSAGFFDVSHMGRLLIRGEAAMEWLDRIVTCRLSDLAVGQVRYGLVCNEQGGVIDDVLVTRWPDAWGLVVNASNHEAVVAWMMAHSVANATMEDVTSSTVMLALQGPDWWRIAQCFLPASIRLLSYYRAAVVCKDGSEWRVSRTGYTGEDGIEIVAPAAVGEILASELLQGGATACGLGARDTLRLEAGMPLYGHELDTQTNPFSAGLGRSVDLSKAFCGSTALGELRDDTHGAIRVGLVLDGRRAARQGDQVLDGDGIQMGCVTSGTFSPTLERPIAMAYIRRELAVPGQVVSLLVRDAHVPGQVTGLPFYKRQTR
jgi:aminomethyltransferase